MFCFAPRKPNLKFFAIKASNNQLSPKFFGVNLSKSWFKDHCGDLTTKYKVQKLPTTTLNKHFNVKFIDVLIMGLRVLQSSDTTYIVVNIKHCWFHSPHLSIIFVPIIWCYHNITVCCLKKLLFVIKLKVNIVYVLFILIKWLSFIEVRILQASFSFKYV